jgi:asparagine synthase (glutamine-hydrolysing)
MMSVPSRVPFLGEAVRKAMGMLGPNLRLSAKASGMVKFGGSHPGAYFLRRGVFMPWELATMLPADMVHAGLAALDPVDHVANETTPMPRTPFAQVAAMEAALYLRNQLLRDADWAGMANSLEIRVPYVDYELLRAIAPLMVGAPRVSKQLLAAMPSGGPRDIVLARKRTGFGLPMNSWLEDQRSGLDAWRRIPSLASKHCHWSRRYAYVLLDWLRSSV